MRTRITFSKFGPMQYVGHLDLHRSWERTFRRSGLPLEYSQGFHPQPHLNLACALPVGFTSQCEMLDAWVKSDIPIDDISEAMSSALPPGLTIMDIAAIDPHSPALQTLVVSAVYTVTFLDQVPDLSDRLAKVLSAEHLPRIRHNKPYDLRPLIEETKLLPGSDGEGSKLKVQMAARAGATGRPEELLASMDIEFKDTRVHREKLILIDN